MDEAHAARRQRIGQAQTQAVRVEDGRTVAEEHADPEALAYFKRQKSATLAQRTREGAAVADLATVARMRQKDERYAGNFPGMNPLIGTPDDIVEEIRKMSAIGLAGGALVFLNYLKELPYFVQEVLPRLERAGLRNKLV